jgi:hypothetical protein
MTRYAIFGDPFGPGCDPQTSPNPFTLTRAKRLRSSEEAR